MTTDQDLRDRFRGVAEELDVPAPDLSAVRSRGTRRAARRRATGIAAGLAVVIGLSVGVAELDTPVRTPSIEDPVSGPSEEAPTAGPSPTEGPAPADGSSSTAEPDRAAIVGTVELGPSYPWAYTWFGIEGLRGHDEPASVPVWDLGVGRAVATEVGVVFQPAVEAQGVSQPSGGPILFREPTGDIRELAPPAQTQRLLTVAAGRAWFTYATPSSEGTEETLASSDLRNGTVEVLGVSSGVESSTDELVFLDPTEEASPVAYFSCHLQCSLIVGSSVGALVERSTQPGTVDPIAAGWLYGLAASPTGEHLAYVEGPDPNLEDSAVALVVSDLRGTELARIPLPEGISYGSGRVEFTPDGRDVIATDRDGGFLISDVLGDVHVDRLSVPQGLTFHGTRRADG